MTDSLLQDILIEHFKNSPFKKSISAPSCSAGQYNPSCGDKVRINAVINNEIVTDISCEGTGCVISQAAASMICEEALNKKISVLKNLNRDDILRLVGIQLGPTRMKCALLSLHVLHEAIDQYEQSNK